MIILEIIGLKLNGYCTFNLLIQLYQLGWLVLKKSLYLREHLTQFIILEKKIIILDKSFLHLKRSIKTKS